MPDNKKLNNMPRVAIIILNWNNFPDTFCCLHSIKKITYPRVDVIVVDNGSEDDSMKCIQEQFPALIFVELDENLGYAAGNNAGIKYALSAEYDYIHVLNNDTEVLNGSYLTEMVEFLEENSSAGAVGPKVLSPDHQIQETIGHFPSIFLALRSFSRPKQPLDYTQTQQVESISGCCFMVRSETIREVGFLDENFFLYGEETEWFFRMRIESWKIYYHPVESVIHMGKSSTEKLEEIRVYIEKRSNVIYTLVKHGKKAQALLFACLMSLVLMIRLIIPGSPLSQPGRQLGIKAVVHELLKQTNRKWKMAIEQEH